MQINWRDPNQWTVNTNAEWDEKKQALKFTGYHNSWLKKPIIIDPNKHYQISASVFYEQAGSGNLYIGGNVCNKQGQRVTSNFLYTLCCAEPYQQFLNKWTTFNTVHYGTQPIVARTRYNFETTGWTGDTSNQDITDKMTYFYYFGGLFNYSSTSQGIMYIKDIKIIILDEDNSNCTFNSDGAYIESSTINLYSGQNMGIYNNYGVPANLIKLNEFYNEQPIYRLQMTVDDQHQSYLENFRTVFQNHGVFVYLRLQFLANTKYCNSIFWRPVNKKDISINGVASNIQGWIGGGTTKNADGWFRTIQYRDGTVTTDKEDYTFWSFKCPSLELNETVYIDFCCCQLEKDKIYQNQYASTNRGNGTLQLPAELFPQQNGTIICNAKLNHDTDAKIFDNANDMDGNNIKLMSNNTVSFNQNGTVKVVNVDNIKQFHNYTYVIKTENGVSSVDLYIDGVLKDTINQPVYQNKTVFSLGKDVSGSFLGSITIKDFSIYDRQLTNSEISKLSKNFQTIQKTGNVVGKIKETENLLQPPYTNDFWNTNNFYSVFDRYEQLNCFVTKEPKSSGFNKYCCSIYRVPNLIYQSNRTIICNTAAGSNTIVLQSGTTQNINIGDCISLSGYPLITEILDSTTFKINTNATTTQNNVSITVSSNTMYGGMRIVLPESTKEVGKTYRLSFKAKGQSSNILESYFDFLVGWGGYGMGLQSRYVFDKQYPPQDFISKEWKHFQCFYTVETNRFMNGTIYLSTTQGSKIAQIKSGYYANMQIGEVLKDNPNLQSDTAVAAIPNYQTTIELSKEAIQTGTEVLTRTTTYYDTYRQFKIGFSYSNTGQLGTKLFIDDIKIEEVSVSKKYFSISKKVITPKLRESINKVYALGSSSQVTGVQFDPCIAREFAINGVSTVPASGRGLTLIKFEKNGNILFNQCFDIYNNTTENIDSFISQMQQITNSSYWCLMSYDACHTNEQLINYMKEIKANKFSEHDWNTEPQTPYVQVGKGQNCLKEELVNNNTYVWYATITYYF